jgi:hypothetical protein
MTATDKQYDEVIRSCKEIFLRKAMDYGTAWRVLRTISIVDQIFIKHNAFVRSRKQGSKKWLMIFLQNSRGLLIMPSLVLFQLDLTESDPEEMPVERISPMFDEKVGRC